MKALHCPNCSSRVFFENTLCLACGSELSFDPESFEMTSQPAEPGTPAGDCRNRNDGVCNWNLSGAENEAFCVACELNRVIPALTDDAAFSAWRELERAKHRVIYGIKRFRLPLRSKLSDPERGLAFDFLSADGTGGPVTTGHLNGVITIDVAEADTLLRERRRLELNEPYRTLVGHFRHEIGHYYWDILLPNEADKLGEFRNLFGDERVDYGSALMNYHESGPPTDWSEHFVTSYSSAHPWEDWAETWAHYMHIVDLVESAEQIGALGNSDRSKAGSAVTSAAFDPYHSTNFDEIFDRGAEITAAVNSLNRSMGQPDLYPFVIPPPAKERLRLVHRLIHDAASD